MPVRSRATMWRQDGHREVEEQAARTEPQPPAPAVVPGSLAWASAVGNQAVARHAALARQPEELEEVEDASEELTFAHGEKPEHAAAGPEAEEEAEEELPE
jgi:hypothetical protein